MNELRFVDPHLWDQVLAGLGVIAGVLLLAAYLWWKVDHPGSGD